MFTFYLGILSSNVLPPYHLPSNGAAENCAKNFKLAIKKNEREEIDLEQAMYRYLFD